MGHVTTKEIIVNEHPVKIAGDHVTGLHIKDSAIEQGARLNLHDQLFKETADGLVPIEDKETTRLHELERFVTKAKELEILVNERPVVVSKHELTGLEIKQAAIAQQVPIQIDFILSEEIGERRSRIVGDNDKVCVHRHSRFIAVAPDDNS